MECLGVCCLIICETFCHGMCYALRRQCCKSSDDSDSSNSCCHCRCISCLRCHILFFDFVSVGFTLFLHIATYFQRYHILLNHVIIKVITMALFILALGIFIYDIKTKVKRNTDSCSTIGIAFGIHSVFFIACIGIYFLAWRDTGQLVNIGMGGVCSSSFLISFFLELMIYAAYKKDKVDLENKKNNEQQNNDDINNSSNNQNYVSITTIDNEQNANEPAPHI